MHTCRNHLLQEDLNHFLEPDEVVEAFSMLDQDKDGRVSLREMRKTIVNVYKVCTCFSNVHLSRPVHSSCPLYP